MIRRYAFPLLLVLLVACGASQRERTLRVTLTAAQTAQAGFIAWDRERLHHIAITATSKGDALEQQAAYEKQRAPVLTAFEATYRAIAAAALLDKDDRSLLDTLAAAEQLRRALSLLTGGRLP